MRSEVVDTVTIYEINGLRYTGAEKIDIKSHPRFMNFVRLSIDNHEYSLAADDLMRAVGHALGQVQLPEDDALVGGFASQTDQSAGEQREPEKQNENTSALDKAGATLPCLPRL